VDGYHQRTPLPDTEREHIIQEMAAFGGKLQALEQHMRPQPWMKILCFTWGTALGRKSRSWPRWERCHDSRKNRWTNNWRATTGMNCTRLFSIANLDLRSAVKKMRQISGLTQVEFAAHRGLSAKVIKEIERGTGNPTVKTLNQIGTFFGLEVAFVRTHKTPAEEPSSSHANLTELQQLLRELDRIKSALEVQKQKSPVDQ
jgi:transcriptional regulator with XRE-family HTH domain